MGKEERWSLGLVVEPDPEIRGADVEVRNSWSRVKHRLAPSVGAFIEASAWLAGACVLVMAGRPQERGLPMEEHHLLYVWAGRSQERLMPSDSWWRSTTKGGAAPTIRAPAPARGLRGRPPQHRQQYQS